MKNSRGITLIELLIVLSLIGLVMSLGTTLFMFGNRNFIHQNEQAAIVADARYSMDYITQQIRKATDVEVNENVLIVDSNEIKMQDNTLYNNGDKILTGVDGFVITKNESEVRIEITIIDRNSVEHKLDSVVYIR